MKINLYDREGKLRVDSYLYEKGDIATDPGASGCLEIERGSVSIGVWVTTVEEAEVLIAELESIKEHLENQPEEAP